MSSRQGSSSSQISFTAWLCLGISKPSTSSSHLRLPYSWSRLALAKCCWGVTLACIIQETQGSSYPVGSTRSCWNTTILPLHNWSSMAGRDWWLLVTAIPCSWLAWVNPSSWPTNSNQGSTIRGGYNQHTQKAHLKYPPWVIGEAVPLDPTTLGHTTKTGSYSSSA